MFGSLFRVLNVAAAAAAAAAVVVVEYQKRESEKGVKQKNSAPSADRKKFLSFLNHLQRN